MRVRADRRRGGAAVVALACLSVIALVLAGLLRVNASHADQLRRIERRVQAAWLVEAGVERAVARLRVDPSYEGESWSIPVDGPGGQGATVVIGVEPQGGGNSGLRLVRVRAEGPTDGDPSGLVRRSKVVQVRPPAGDQGEE